MCLDFGYFPSYLSHGDVERSELADVYKGLRIVPGIYNCSIGINYRLLLLLDCT